MRKEKHDGGQVLADDAYGCVGMSLRDYFAAAALTGLLASRIAAERGHTKQDIAEVAYENADAMLAARKEGAK